MSTFCGIDSINDDDPHVNPSQSITYYVQVTDVNGCTSGVDSVHVTLFPKPVVDAGPDLLICGLNSPCAVLQPSISSGGPFAFEWFPAVGLNDSSLFNPCARPDTTTIYTLVATDLSTGCSSDYNTLDTNSTAVVNVQPLPIAHGGPDRDICYGDTVELQGFGSGAGPSYQYQWTPSQSVDHPTSPNPLAFPSLATTYSLVVWSNGCPSIADSVRVVVHTNPTVDAGWNRDICLGDSTMLDATAAGDSSAQYTFHWTSPLGLNDPFLEDPIATPPRTVTYFVVATSTWGCRSAMDSVLVTIRPTPIADAGADTTVCFGRPATLHGGYHYAGTDSVPNPSQILYSWSPSNGMNDSTLSNPLLYPTASGMYHFSVDYTICHTEDSVLVIVVPDLGAGISADTTVICQGDSLGFHATGGLANPAYNWSPPSLFDDATAQNPIGILSDTTNVTLVLSEAGCHDTLQLEIGVMARPDAAFLHSPEIGCAPLALSLLENGNAATAYIWNFGDGSPVSNLPSPTHVYTIPGTYSLNFTALNPGACAGRGTPLTVTVFAQPQPSVTALPDYPTVLYLPAATVAFQEHDPMAAEAVWDFSDGIQQPGMDVVHSFQDAGIYFVVLHTRTAEGCTAVDTLGPYDVRIPELFIPNVFSPNGDGINDRFMVNYSGDQHFDLRIADRWGKPLYQSNRKNQGWDGQFEGEAVPDGVYYYYLRIGPKDYTGPVSLLR